MTEVRAPKRWSEGAGTKEWGSGNDGVKTGSPPSRGRRLGAETTVGGASRLLIWLSSSCLLFLRRGARFLQLRRWFL